MWSRVRLSEEKMEKSQSIGVLLRLCGLSFAGSHLCPQVHGFFKGVTLPLATISMTSSVVFGTYRNCLQCLSQARRAGCGPNTKPEIFLSGLAAGVAQVPDIIFLNCISNAFHSTCK